MDNVSELSDEMLISNMDKRVEFEAENEAELIDYFREVMLRRLYIEFGADSMFDFLIRARYKYSRHIALAKLDAAKVMQNFPQIKQWLYVEEINVTQLGMFQKAVRQNSPSLELQEEILEEIRNQTVENTQFILCEKLGLEVKGSTKVRIQRDGSRRVEITFTEYQWATIENAKSVISHSIPSGDLGEVLVYCAKFTSNEKDPAAPLKKRKPKLSDKANPAPPQNPQSTPIIGVQARQPRKVSRANRRIVFQEQKGCQFQHPDGTYCGSRYQLQVDHVISLWAGGSNDLENLQILCGVHNREKFRREVDWPPPLPHDL